MRREDFDLKRKNEWEGLIVCMRCALVCESSLATLLTVACKPDPLKLKVMAPRNRSGVQDY